MKIKYQCELCRKFYNTEKAANYCEGSHEPVYMFNCEYSEESFTVPTEAHVSTPCGICIYVLQNEYKANDVQERDKKIKEALEKLESGT